MVGRQSASGSSASGACGAATSVDNLETAKRSSADNAAHAASQFYTVLELCGGHLPFKDLVRCLRVSRSTARVARAEAAQRASLDFLPGVKGMPNDYQLRVLQRLTPRLRKLAIDGCRLSPSGASVLRRFRFLEDLDLLCPQQSVNEFLQELFRDASFQETDDVAGAPIINFIATLRVLKLAAFSRAVTPPTAEVSSSRVSEWNLSSLALEFNYPVHFSSFVLAIAKKCKQSLKSVSLTDMDEFGMRELAALVGANLSRFDYTFSSSLGARVDDSLLRLLPVWFPRLLELRLCVSGKRLSGLNHGVYFFVSGQRRNRSV
eukprot:GHVT01103245.1.p1 GENE.GHVT01103245.1~~GHVT01103245.1.p1  ORF type:complete len:319 (-),score=66.63 GHVT01103245.1:414-1370(-)